VGVNCAVWMASSRGAVTIAGWVGNGRDCADSIRVAKVEPNAAVMVAGATGPRKLAALTLTTANGAAEARNRSTDCWMTIAPNDRETITAGISKRTLSRYRAHISKPSEIKFVFRGITLEKLSNRSD